MTAGEVINEAYATATITAAGETPSTEETAYGLSKLQKMLQQWNEIIKRSLAGSNVSSLVTFTPVTIPASAAASLAVPDGWLRAVELNLAIELSFAHGKAVDAALAATAQAAKTGVTTIQPPASF